MAMYKGGVYHEEEPSPPNEKTRPKAEKEEWKGEQERKS